MPLYTNREESEDYLTLIDDAGSNTYIGIASVGSSQSSALWKIKRINESGAATIVSWADGSTSFDKVWNDRLTYNYTP